jgi:hypothetical protein
MRAMGMWWLSIILLGLGSCFSITLIFGLLRASRRADEGEERILKIISPAPRDDITTLEDTANAADAGVSPPIYT